VHKKQAQYINHIILEARHIKTRPEWCKSFKKEIFISNRQKDVSVQQIRPNSGPCNRGKEETLSHNLESLVGRKSDLINYAIWSL